MTKPGDAASLERHMRWLGVEGCPCPFEWQNLGRLHDVSMGKGWVRLSTDPSCSYHGDRSPNRCDRRNRSAP